MKKVLIAMLLMAASFIPVGFPVSPAQAAIVCGDTVSMTKSKYWSPLHWSGDIVHRVYYKRCNANTMVKVLRYVVAFHPDGDANCNISNNWRVNPNVIGDWNPGQREVDCRLTAHNIEWDAPAGTYASASDPLNERCLGAHVVFEDLIENDPETDLPSLCII